MQTLRNMFKFIFSSLLIVCSLVVATAQQQDSASISDNPTQKIVANKHQLRLSANISSPIIYQWMKDRTHYEVALDYSFKNETYLVVSGGVGSSKMDEPELRYTSTNSFVRVGIDKSMLQRLFPKDWDMMFIGLHYGIAPITRKVATYTIYDNFWGTTSGTIPAKQSIAHWASLTLGTRVELFSHFFAGYNLRANFLVNPNSFKELPPVYVAGYGKVEKGTTFDFALYLSYALRWNR